MTISQCATCPTLEVFQWRQGRDWEPSNAYPEDFQTLNQSENLVSNLANAQVCVIIANANTIGNCQQCREVLSQSFEMRESWWSSHYKRSNGYFGCETTRQGNKVTGVNTWTYFEIKQLFKDMSYKWNKLNVFTRWIPSTQQTFIIIFDLKPYVRKEILGSLWRSNLKLIADPYWPYPIFFDAIARLEEAAVWRIRDRVRSIETQKQQQGVPNPDYRKLHDIGRHAIHVSETLDVAVQSIESIQRHHINQIMSKTYDRDDEVNEDIRAQMEFFRGFISNLRHRSTSNEKRLQNEIQLAFNVVAQYNAGTSVEIGRAAQIDSSAMKTIAFVTLIFLPPTFISSVFSMSFFQCGGSNGWAMSDRFWIYWVFAIPTTIATVSVWQYWHNLFPGPEYKKPVKQVEDSPGDIEMNQLPWTTQTPGVYGHRGPTQR